MFLSQNIESTVFSNFARFQVLLFSKSQEPTARKDNDTSNENSNEIKETKLEQEQVPITGIHSEFTEVLKKSERAW